jgi:hypothetical protein
MWNKRIDGFLKKKGLKQCKSNTNIYILMEQEQDVYLVFYVDDYYYLIRALMKSKGSK